MATFRIGKIESLLTSFSRRRNVLRKELQDELLIEAKQFLSGQVTQLDLVIREIADEFGIKDFSEEERQPEKKGQTILRLRKDGHNDIAEKVRDWRSSKGNHYGWDSWFVSEYGEDFARRYGINTVPVGRR